MISNLKHLNKQYVKEIENWLEFTNLETGEERWGKFKHIEKNESVEENLIIEEEDY